MGPAACGLPVGCAPVKRLLLAVCVALAGCQSAPRIQVVTCAPIPASLTRDCGRCLPDDPVPATNGELAEAYLDCRQCVAEQRIRLDAVRELAECRVPDTETPAL